LFTHVGFQTKRSVSSGDLAWRGALLKGTLPASYPMTTAHCPLSSSSFALSLSCFSIEPLRGVMECWSGGVMGKPSTPELHYSTPTTPLNGPAFRTCSVNCSTTSANFWPSAAEIQSKWKRSGSMPMYSIIRWKSMIRRRA